MGLAKNDPVRRDAMEFLSHYLGIRTPRDQPIAREASARPPGSGIVGNLKKIK